MRAWTTAWAGMGVAALLAAGAARAEVAEVRLGVQYGLIYLPPAIAAAEGFYETRAREQGLPGLKVTINRFSGSTAMNEALLSNSIDMGTVGLPGLLIIAEKTKGRQGIKGLFGLATTAYRLYTNKPAIKSIKDFGPDDKVALPAFNSPQAILLRMGAEQALGPDGVKKAESWMVSLPHPDAVAALLGGTAITGYFASPPFTQVLAKDHRAIEVTTSAAILGGIESTGVALSGTEKFYAANPKVMKVLIAAEEDALALIKSNPKRAAEIYIQAENAKVPVDEVIPQLNDGSTGYMLAPQGVMKMAEFMVKTGMLGAAPARWQDIFFPPIHDRPGS